MCQRPKRASFISTQASPKDEWDDCKCVNALNGLLSFLPRRVPTVILRRQKSVNALNGLLSFLLLHFFTVFA